MLLKRNLVEALIFRFHNWLNKFDFHIDTSGIPIDVILTQLGDDGLDHPNVYASKKHNKVE